MVRSITTVVVFSSVERVHVPHVPVASQNVHAVFRRESRTARSGM
jgi:hypothetical protein